MEVTCFPVSDPYALTWYSAAASIVVLIAAMAIILSIYWTYQKTTPIPPPPIPATSSNQSSNSGANGMRGANGVSGSRDTRGTRDTMYRARQDPFSLQSNYGSWSMVRGEVQPYDMDTCENDERRMWLVNHKECRCRYPYYGPDCTHEVHADHYYAVGNIPLDHLPYVKGMDSVILHTTATKSHGLDSCSARCDATEGCHGFMFDPSSEGNNCVLLGDPVEFDSHMIDYHPHNHSTIYTKDPSMLRPRDRIYLAQGSAFFPPRFWLEPNVGGFAALRRGQVHTIDFQPTIAHMDQSYVGIYSRHPFQAHHHHLMYEEGHTPHTTIHYPGTELKLPDHWKGKLYVMYH